MKLTRKPTKQFTKTATTKEPKDMTMYKVKLYLLFHVFHGMERGENRPIDAPSRETHPEAETQRQNSSQKQLQLKNQRT